MAGLRNLSAEARSPFNLPRSGLVQQTAQCSAAIAGNLTRFCAHLSLVLGYSPINQLPYKDQFMVAGSASKGPSGVLVGDLAEVTAVHEMRLYFAS